MSSEMYAKTNVHIFEDSMALLLHSPKKSQKTKKQLKIKKKNIDITAAMKTLCH